MAPSDGHLGPGHVGGGFCTSSIDLFMLLPPTVLVDGLACEDNVSDMLFRELVSNGADWSGCWLLNGWSWRADWRGKREGLALGDPS